MAKTRMIQSKFWADGWVRKINPLDRYLFLYFLTNEHTNICGIYELPIETMAFESGLDREELLNSMLPKLGPKLFYHEGWVIIPNFARHQASDHPKVQKGVELALKAIPSRILEKAIECGYPIHRDTIAFLYSDSDSDLKSEAHASPLKENTEPETPPTFQKWLAENSDEEYIDDQVVYYQSGKAVSLRNLEKQYSKLSPASPKRPLNAPRSRVWVDYEYHLDELRKSTKKVEKIIALIWKEKGYYFDNYEKWRAQLGKDVKYARELEGYSGAEVLEAIRKCQEESVKAGYDWGVSTVAKKIAQVTV